MKKLKSYKQFLNESKQDNIVNVILDALEPTIVEMVNETEAWFSVKFKQEFTDFDREMTRLNLIFDMVKAIESYTKPTDQLLSMNVRKSVKGNIQIDAQIQRDRETYSFSTEAIYAGGHNIQRLHYRYITKTSIPKTGASVISKEYSNKIKKMTKAEKLNFDIENLERDITRVKEKLAKHVPMTDAQIEQELIDAQYWAYKANPTWDELVKRDAAKNYNNSEEEYNASVAKNKADGIEFWKTQNIQWPTNRLKALEKALAKERAKLAAIMSDSQH